MQTNKQIRAESLPILYAENNFKILICSSEARGVFRFHPDLRMIYDLEHGRLGAPGTSSLRFIEDITISFDRRLSTNYLRSLDCDPLMPRVTCRMSAERGNGIAGARIAGQALDWTSFEEVSAAYRDATLQGGLLHKFWETWKNSRYLPMDRGKMIHRWEDTSLIMAKALWLLGRECPIARQCVSITLSEPRFDLRSDPIMADRLLMSHLEAMLRSEFEYST